MLRSSECVSPSHPDKICDQISAAINAEILRRDSGARVAVETMGGHGKVWICGEVTTKNTFDPVKIAKEVLKIRHAHAPVKTVESWIAEQSSEIACGTNDQVQGAGDQGVTAGFYFHHGLGGHMFEHALAKKLCQHLYQLYPYDGKTQITCDVESREITSVVCSWSHVPGEVLNKEIKKYLRKYQAKNAQFLINPCGDWSQSGFEADTGLTGRKLAVDFYGANVPLGGGNLHGKDFTKVDVSGNLYARHLARTLGKKHQADVAIHLSWAIGIPQSTSAIAVIGKKEIELKPVSVRECLQWCQKHIDPLKLAQWGIE